MRSFGSENCLPELLFLKKYQTLKHNLRKHSGVGGREQDERREGASKPVNLIFKRN